MTAHQLMLGEWAVDPRDCWATPPELFAALDEELHATVDVCAEERTAKVSRFWTPADDGLSQDWSKERAFCNPPYSLVLPWSQKCREAQVACLLVPVSSDAAWWHESLQHVCCVDFFRGRIDFIPPPGIEASTCNGRHCLMWFRKDIAQAGNWLRVRSRDAKTGQLIG